MNKLLANENFPLTSVRYLLEKGFDVRSIRLDSPGISDEEVLERGILENRIIMTFDSDYGTLIFKYQKRPPAGVIYFRMDAPTPDLPGKIIETLLQNPDFDLDFKLLVIDESKMRVKNY